MVETEILARRLRGYSRLAELRRSEFFAVNRADLESILATPEVLANSDTRPLLQSFIRVAQWNIEKGKKLEGVVELLRHHEALRWADIVIVNEADRGMNRSGNRHTAHYLAQALGMNMVFGAAWLELTKGTGEELELEGENREGLQGNAVLSRYPIIDAVIARLPVCFEPFEFDEKRYGGRNCVWARIQAGSRPLWVGATHLEVRETPRCRALQMRALVAGIPCGRESSVLLGGDMNSNGFRRGSMLRTLHSIGRLLGRPATRVRQTLLHPEQGSEPLFREAEKGCLAWSGLNSHDPTATAELGGLEDAGMLPRRLVSYVQKKLEPYGGRLQFKLDWFFGRAILPLAAGEVRDAATGIVSRDPGCVGTDRTSADRLSDHSPIFADFRCAAPNGKS